MGGGGREVAGKIRPFRSRACCPADLRAPRGRTLCKGENCLFASTKRTFRGSRREVLSSQWGQNLLCWYGVWIRLLSRLDHSRGRHFSIFFILLSEQIALNYSTLMMYICRLAAFLLPSPLYANLGYQLSNAGKSLSVKCDRAPEAQSSCCMLAPKK